MRSLAGILLHPGTTATLRTWIHLLRHGGGVDFRYLPIAAVVTVLNIIYLPLRLLESALWARKISKTQIVRPPVFILGHWRSGTTLLHMAMAKDPNLAYVTTLQAFTPCGAVGGSKLLLPLLKRVVKPSKRVTDDIMVGLEDPQEEEFAVGGLSPYSLYSRTVFPRSHRRLLRQMVLFDPAYGDHKQRWKAVYLRVLKVATLLGGGRRLVLKNPCNTGRVPALLELFPDAKFIHISRDPLETYVSSTKLLCRFAHEVALQRWTPDQFGEMVLETYETIMAKYWRDRALIPAGNLVEVRYEDFYGDIVGELGRVYEELGLEGFSEARPEFERFAASQKGFRTSTHRVPRGALEKLLPRLAFAFDELGYELPRAGA